MTMLGFLQGEEKDLQLATEDTYKSMSETSKSFEEIEQDEFNHDDIEI
jgi:hypothetical protein